MTREPEPPSHARGNTQRLRQPCDKPIDRHTHRRTVAPMTATPTTATPSAGTEPTTRWWWTPGLIFAAIAMVGVLGDTITTVYGITTGTASEGNPMSATLIANYGLGAWVAVATLSSSLLAVWAAIRPTNAAMWALLCVPAYLTAMKLATTWNNIVIITNHPHA